MQAILELDKSDETCAKSGMNGDSFRADFYDVKHSNDKLNFIIQLQRNLIAYQWLIRIFNLASSKSEISPSDSEANKRKKTSIEDVFIAF